MVQFGTVVNGVLVFDGPPPPEGTRLRLEPSEAEADWPEGQPPWQETREEVLESLRQSIAETKGGVQGMPLAEFAARLKQEYGTPDEHGEKP